MPELPEQSQARFEALVRDALLHLYDASYLRSHPLRRLLLPSGSGASEGSGDVLFQVLVGIVESLRPTAGTKPGAPAWRKHRILESRYLEGLSARQVMSDLALSKTQYHRDHGSALAAVAAEMRDRLPTGMVPPASGSGDVASQGLALAEADEIATHSSPELLDLESVCRDLLDLLRSGFEERGTRLAFQAGAEHSAVFADRGALRQVLLGLLDMAMNWGSGCDLVWSLSSDSGWVVLSLSAELLDHGLATRSPDQGGLEMSILQRLTGAMGGILQTGAVEGQNWCATLRLPSARRPRLLVVDNHRDFISLVSRFLEASDWEVVGASSVAEARSLVDDIQPNAILLDVMLPQQDGWDLLLSLKARPNTKAIPVIICSVLNEPQIATALGAAGYLAKPVSRDTLLRSLERWRPGRSAGEPTS